MHILLVDHAPWRQQLYPLALTRPVADLRIGILTIAEKWGKWLNAPCSFWTAPHLREKFSPNPALYDSTASDGWSSEGIVLIIRGNLLPDERLCERISALKPGQGLRDLHGLLVLKLEASNFDVFQSNPDKVGVYDLQDWVDPYSIIRFPEDIFQLNGTELEKDFNLITKGRVSAKIAESNQLLGDRIFAEEGAVVEYSILNSRTGPIYLGKNSEIWEGSTIRGSFSLGEDAQVRMGTRVYGNVTVGPQSRVGGELSTCVLWGRSSKVHDGHLGCAVLGEWCNLGAGTSNSNLKNTYKSVRVFDYMNNAFRDSGLQFYGMVMGDHVKCAINTAFNTGTVVGVGANVFGAGFPPAFIPDFSWGGSEGFSTYRLEGMFETASLVYPRRNRIFDEIERKLLRNVFELTKQYR